MSDAGAAIGRGTRAAEALLWACAGVAVLAAHVGGAAWLLKDPPVMAAEDAPPAAIMIELAPEPEAVFTEANEIAPDAEAAAPSMPADEAPTPEEAEIEELADPAEPDAAEALSEAGREEPEPVMDEPMEEETVSVEDDAVVLPDGIDVPVPASRPRPPERKAAEADRPKPKSTEARKPVRKKEPPRAASTSASRAQAEVTPSDRNAGRQSASGRSSVSPARWMSRIMAHLERRKRYPSAARSRGDQGTVHVRFSIDAGGNVLSVALARSSGSPDLDGEVLALVRRAAPFPAPPSGMTESITAPVRFSVR